MANSQQRQTPAVLVTGGYGCIGAETTKWLLRNSSAKVVVGSRQVGDERSQRVFHDVEPEDWSRLKFVAVDVVDRAALLELLVDEQITHVVHLAALQTPDCNAHRDLGLQINLAGTQNLIEAMKSCPPRADGPPFARFVNASSVAVYGPRAAYPPGRVPMLAEPQPVNVYGAWKLAGEQLAKFFWQDTGVPTLNLRPGVLYGPGRDAGLTSTPTTAMKCVALGLPYQIPFKSRQDYLYAPDVGGAIGNALLEPFEGHGVFTLPSLTLDTRQIVDAMQRAAEELGIGEAFKISVGDEEVPFICDLEFAPFTDQFPGVPHTPLDEAIQSSLEVFREQVRRGWLK